MAGSKKKVLLISLGSIGQRHLRNTRSMLPDAEIAVYRQYTKGNGDVPEGADLLFDNIQDALAFMPDAVINASPASEHIQTAEPFIKVDTPMFLEKPLADTSEGVDRFAKLVKASSGFTMVGYVLRFLPILNHIRNMIENDEFGTVWTARAEVGQYLPDWRPDSDYRQGVSAQRALGGGALLELSHELDYALWLFGNPDSLQASTGRLSKLEIDVEDCAQVIYEYPRRKVCVQVDFLQRVANMALQVVGEKGTLRADLIKEEAYFYTPENPEGVKINAPATKEGNELYLRQFDFFFSKAFEDYKLMFDETASFDQWADIGQAVSVLRLVDQAKLANSTGRRLPFPEGEL